METRAVVLGVVVRVPTHKVPGVQVTYVEIGSQVVTSPTTSTSTASIGVAVFPPSTWDPLTIGGTVLFPVVSVFQILVVPYLPFTVGPWQEVALGFYSTTGGSPSSTTVDSRLHLSQFLPTHSGLWTSTETTLDLVFLPWPGQTVGV